MPPAEVILQATSTMARELVGVAIAWHVVLLVIGFAIAIRRESSHRIVHVGMVALALSVAVSALAYGNPFNAASFGLLALGIAFAGARPHRTDAPLPVLVLLVGVGAFVYGWTYSHFAAGSWHQLAWASPIGIVPCPTLAILGGAAIVTGGFGSRWLLGILAAWTTFYATYGTLVLGVWLDLGLFVIALTLAMLGLHHYRGLFVHRRPRSA